MSEPTLNDEEGLNLDRFVYGVSYSLGPTRLDPRLMVTRLSEDRELIGYCYAGIELPVAAITRRRAGIPV